MPEKQFVVSARKYRPDTFDMVIGQATVTNTLRRQIEQQRIAHAYLFCGPRGVGKTTCARIFAKTICCTNRTPEGEACNACKSCEQFNSGNSRDISEFDAASNNKTDDIRRLIEQVNENTPIFGKYCVYIIDEVHMLSNAAFNAFLKTLEEPPAHAIFILATTEKHKVIPTILSRCQIFDFKRITINDAREYLKYIAKEQGLEAEDEALQIIAQKADGAMRDALSIFDRVVSFCGKTITRQAVSEILNVLDYDTYFKVTDLIVSNNIPQLLIEFNSILAHGFDGQHFIAGLAGHFRDLMVCKNSQTVSLMEVGEETQKKYIEQTTKCDFPFLVEALRIATQCDLEYKTSRTPRLLVELALMQLASLTYQGDKKKMMDI